MSDVDITLSVCVVILWISNILLYRWVSKLQDLVFIQTSAIVKLAQPVPKQKNPS